MKESDLYEPIKDLFESKGYDVYAEVTVRYTGGRIDIVAAAPPAYTAIEMKTTLSVELIAQAIERKNVFPLVYIAIPYPKKRKQISRWLLDYLKAEGIGIIYVYNSYNTNFAAIHLGAKWRKPRYGRRVDLTKILREEHKTWAVGGTNGGGYVTPYRLTMVGVKNYLRNARKTDENLIGTVETAGWRNMNDILEVCETHYQTPRSSLAKAMLEFEDGIESKKFKNRLYFRLKGDE